MKKLLLSLLITGVLLTPISFAQRVEKRKDNQKERIKEGKESGDLTHHEAAKLSREERQLNKEIRKDRVDGGGLSAKERVKIEKKQDKMNRKIERQKHDNQEK